LKSDAEVSQTSLKKHSERPWRIKFLIMLKRLRKIFSYSKRDKALVELGFARKCLVECLDNQLDVKNVFELVREAERLFEEKHFDESVEKSREAVRKLDVMRGDNLDSLVLGRRLSRKYGGVPKSEVEKRHVILKASSMVQGDGLFTAGQVERVLKEGFKDPDVLTGLLDGVDEVLENHGDVSVEQVFAGVPLYKIDD
jgi:hypothetical protein